jgi:hypothetical protein
MATEKEPKPPTSADIEAEILSACASITDPRDRAREYMYATDALSIEGKETALARAYKDAQSLPATAERLSVLRDLRQRVGNLEREKQHALHP